ncbi:MAG: cell surface protein SprA, partial [Muribaculaceae bacterium]|nr:cell surface protein SprA [Muribaculaceae bacterium]
TTMVEHNLKTKKVRFRATANGKPITLKTRVVDENNLEILSKGSTNIKVIVTEDQKENKNSKLANDLADHALRFLMMPRQASFRFRNSHSLNLPQFSPNIGDIFGQSTAYGPMSPGLDFAFGFYDETYVQKALDRNWLLTDNNQVSPAIWNQSKEFNFELTLEPIRGLKITLTSNLTDSRTRQVQFMYEGMPTSRSGSYTRTHVALLSALKGSSADDGYASAAFSRFLDYIPQIAARYESVYRGMRYPTTGFMEGNPLGGTVYNPEVGQVSATSSDVLIPAFLAAYSGGDPGKVTLDIFPGLSSMLPNWKITYDGFINLGNLKKVFKSFTLSHAYQCTYQVGSYNSYLDWQSVEGDYGFTLDSQSNQPVPSSPYNIGSVAITEKFAPLIGLKLTFQNDLTVNAEYKDSRTLNLNPSAGQVVETTSQQFTVGAGYKIANFNKILKIGSRQGNVSNDLSLNLDLSYANNSSLIRRIETAYTQATQGTRTFSVNFMASYVLSRRITLNAFFDHQVNTPLVSNTSYPTSNSNYGIGVNVSLAR